jgi:hypothetical protein
VVLSPGNEKGFLPVKYFKHVVNPKKNLVLIDVENFPTPFDRNAATTNSSSTATNSTSTATTTTTTTTNDNNSKSSESIERPAKQQKKTKPNVIVGQ